MDALRRALLYWHLLSLDAPTVAVLWSWFIADSFHVALPPTLLLAIFLAVWILYVTDRLLDVLHTSRSELQKRHKFHFKHRRAFLATIAVASPVLLLLVIQLNSESLRLYLFLSVFVASYLLFIHVFNKNLGKEFAVGAIFSAGVFVPTIGVGHIVSPILLSYLVLFAILCAANCLFISAWEQSAEPQVRLPVLASTALSLGVILVAVAGSPVWPIASAVLTANFILLGLHFNRQRIPPTALRVCTDLALLTPLLVWMVNDAAT